MPFAATEMDLEMSILNEVSQAEKDKYHTILLLYGISKKMIRMNLLQNRDRHTDMEKRGEGREGVI